MYCPSYGNYILATHMRFCKNAPMLNAVIRLWHRIRGIIVATIVLSLLGVAMTGFTIITHGLQWWQQALLVAMFVSVSIWAIYATAMRGRGVFSTSAPLQSETAILEGDVFEESSPRIYLSRIAIGGDNIISETPFILENLGGGVAHRIQIRSITLGYAQIDFGLLDNLPVSRSFEVRPHVQGAEIWANIPSWMS